MNRTACLWLFTGRLEKFHARGRRKVMHSVLPPGVTEKTLASAKELNVVNKVIAAEECFATEFERVNGLDDYLA